MLQRSHTLGYGARPFHWTAKHSFPQTRSTKKPRFLYLFATKDVLTCSVRPLLRVVFNKDFCGRKPTQIKARTLLSDPDKVPPLDL